MRRSIRRRRTLLTYLLLGGITVITLYPVVWMLFGSLKTDNEFYTNIWGPPGEFVWRNYLDAWTIGEIGRCFGNSLVVTGATVALVLTSTALAAYAFARISFPGREILFYLFLLSLMIPPGVLALPTFMVVNQFGLVNTRLALILVYAAGSMAFGIFVLRAYFQTLPRELEDAAFLDGCTPPAAFWYIILPLVRPALVVQGIFAALMTWNEYFIGSLLVRTKAARTLPLGLVSFVEQYTTHYPQYFAALVMMTLPVIIWYILGQQEFLRGLAGDSLRDQLP